MRVLILGGNRFIGAGLATKLATRHKVDVFNRSGTGPEGVNIIQGDRNEI
jgi:nucleoside-diphosphate-sugar epimerase